MQRKKIKIACVIHSLGIGGMERVMSNLINNFSKRDNIEIALLLIGRHRNVEFVLSDNVKVYKPTFRFDNINRSWSTIRTMFFIRKTIKNIKPDTILSFGEMWNNLVLLSLTNVNIPIYISDRSEPNKDLGALHNFLRNRLYPYAKGFIAQTEHSARISRTFHRNSNITVIGNPIRDLKLPAVKKEDIILTVGRLIPTKNVDQLITVFSDVNDKNWELHVVGGDANNMNLLRLYKKQVIKLKIQNQVKFFGQQKNVEQYYAKSKIFAFMSTSEGFSNALGEAMTAGCACIAFDCNAGSSDMIDDGINGFLIPVGDYILFQEKLEFLMNNKDLRIQFGVKAQEKMTLFRSDKISNKFFDTITKTIER
jgi:GalNAc-alpha-(1->4)-GalNAc-alpha-(1->3)-diNAcBac-PP-undecaprenol alpha-1,4-N-acetyl-D-galactosaminyltransferase